MPDPGFRRVCVRQRSRAPPERTGAGSCREHPRRTRPRQSSGVAGSAGRRIFPIAKRCCWWSPGSATICVAASCDIKPGVEIAAKETAPLVWRAGGVTRAGAHLVSHARWRARFRRHAKRRCRAASDRRIESARLQGRALSVPADGCAGWQCVARSLWRRGAGGLSLARPHDGFTRRRPTGNAGQDRSGGHADQRVSSEPRRRRISAPAAARRLIPGPPNGRIAASSCTTPSSLQSLAASMRLLSARNCAASLRRATAPRAYPAVTALKTLAADVRAMLGATREDHLRRRLERICRPPAAAMARTMCSSISIRSGRTRTSTWSASIGIRRSPIGARAPRIWMRRSAGSHSRPGLSRRPHRGRRELRLLLRQRRRPHSADPQRHQRRRLWRAVGFPRQGCAQFLGARAL